jgi:hypothetical protein
MRIRILDPAAQQAHADAAQAAGALVRMASLPKGHLLSGGGLLGSNLPMLVCLIRYQAALHCEGLNPMESQRFTCHYTEEFLFSLQHHLSLHVHSQQARVAARREAGAVLRLLEQAIGCLGQAEERRSN